MKNMLSKKKNGLCLALALLLAAAQGSSSLAGQPVSSRRKFPQNKHRGGKDPWEKTHLDKGKQCNCSQGKTFRENS